MPFQFKQVLVIGATSGIGAGMADRLVHEGAKVIAVGRRQARLDDFVQKHGRDKASALRFDINESQKMDDFVRNVTHTYPDLDCVFLNAGTQSAIDLSQPAKVDLPSFHAEVSTNFFSLVDLSVKFLPFLMKKQNASLILSVSPEFQK
ncbi:MAG: hypothetical protein Q9167_004926 [Letrouitia subvulpina]